jgi:hypothetical protein
MLVKADITIGRKSKTLGRATTAARPYRTGVDRWRKRGSWVQQIRMSSFSCPETTDIDRKFYTLQASHKLHIHFERSSPNDSTESETEIRMQSVPAATRP